MQQNSKLQEEVRKMKNSQIDEKNSQIDENTPVAEQEKPGPNRGEESEIEKPSPLQTTTGGNVADTEWEDEDATYVVPPADIATPIMLPKTQREGKRREWIRERNNSTTSVSTSEGEDRSKKGLSEKRLTDMEMKAYSNYAGKLK